MRALLLSCLIAAASAAVGPDNLLVAVNAESWASRAIANRYLELRGIPPENVVFLDDIGPGEAIPVAAFRSTILQPLLAAIAERGLEERIDAIAFSADFPTRVDCQEDLGDTTFPRVIGRAASSTGLCLLAPVVLKGGPGYLPMIRHPYFAVDGRAGDQLPPALMPRYGEAMTLLRDAGKAAEQAAEAAKQQAEADPAQAGEADAEPPAVDDDSDPIAAGYLAAAAALRALDAEVDHVNLSYNLACAEALAGNADAALAALMRSAELGFWNVDHARKDEDLTALRGDQRFADALARMAAHRFAPVATRGFSRTWGFRPDGGIELGADVRSSPLLACHLAVTTGRGLGVAEALTKLERSVAADGSRPDGTIYLLRNGDVRSTTREWAFASVVDELEALGQAVALERGTIPKGKDDVVGAVIGIAGFDLAGDRVGVLPGAICEHLTSFGGVLRHGAGQTPLTAWLRAGAAGATGTVVEPYAIQDKFPTPFVQLHYRRGATLIEAVWQSVAAPYQLLLVGDPLCAPWAQPPEIALEQAVGPQRDDQPLIRTVVGADLGRVLATIDGRTVHDGTQRRFTIDRDALVPGRHRLRVTTWRDDPIATPALLEREIVIEGPQPELTVDLELRWGETCRLRRPAAHAGVLALALSGDRLVTLGTADTVEIPAAELGLGLTTAQVVALDAAGAITARGAFHRIAVQPAPPMPAQVPAVDPLPGMRLPDGTVLSDDALRDWSTHAALRAGGTVRALVRAEREGLHQLRVAGDRLSTISVDDTGITIDGTGSAPLWLAAGWHQLELVVTAGESRCAVALGDRGEPPLAAGGCYHLPASTPSP